MTTQGISSRIKPRQQRKLEFIHITKTGGTAVEQAAARAGITWGACHFEQHEGCRAPPDMAQTERRALKHNIPIPNFDGELWHTPPSWFVENPYQGSDTFTIVRNPYERYLSEYYCKYYGIHRPGREGRSSSSLFRPHPLRPLQRGGFVARHGQNKDAGLVQQQPRRNGQIRRNDGRRLTVQKSHVQMLKSAETPESLNAWLSEKLHGRHFPTRTGHLLPQFLYVYGLDGEEKVVDHVLRFESLHAEFAELMDLYQLPVQLSKEPVNRGRAERPRMTVDDLSAKSIRLINEYAAEDFELFGYDIMVPEPTRE